MYKLLQRQLFNEVVMSEETRILGSSIPFVDLVPDSLVQTIYVVVVRLVYVRTPSSQTTNAEI